MNSIINAVRDFASLFRHLVSAIWKRKTWWMVPIIVVFMFILALVVLAETPLGPFIYTLF